MKTITLDYCGMTGSGRTVTEAKQDAARKLTAAMDGSYCPEIIAYRGHAALVVRSPHGWGFKTIADPERGIIPGMACSGGNEDYAGAMFAARQHVAQQSWQPADGTEAPPILETPRAVAEFRRWALWQLRFRYATAAGLTHQEAHQWAGHAPGRTDLFDRLPNCDVTAAPSVS